MNIDKGLLVNIVLLIHLALTGIMLFRLFKTKNATGGQLILTFIALTVPVIGPSALIVYYNNLAKRQDIAQANKKTSAYAPRQNYSKRKKR